MEAPARDPQPPLTEDVAELHLLIGEMDDELTRYRWREAVWVSIVVHVVAFLLIIFLPKYFPRGATVIPVFQEAQNNKNITFTAMPRDQQRVKPPDTTTLSDKNRIAMSRTPLPSREMMRKILDANKAGRPAHPTPQAAPARQAAQQQNPAQGNQQQQAANPTPPPPQPAQTAQLQTPPPAAAKNPFKTSAPGIQQAIQSMGTGRVQTHYNLPGDYGSQLQPNSNIHGDVEILSDTMGVDFGPYLQRVLYVIRKNWINLIPEGAFAKKGKVGYQFAILKNGKITALQRVLPSGDVVLDRAAYGGISDSDPLDQLPREFKGDYLALRIIFLYNMDLNSSELR